MTQFQLGVGSTLIGQKVADSRKRTSSQTSLDSFFTPTTEAKKTTPIRPIVFNPLITETPTKSSKPIKKTPKSKSPRKRLSKSNSIGGSSTPRKTPGKISAPSTTSKLLLSKEAKKLIKKSKSLKQMDVRRSLLKKRASLEGGVSNGGERRKSAEDLRVLRLAEKQLMKERLKQDRMRRSKELREKRMRERREQMEWLKPREDFECEDSKVSVTTPLITTPI